MLIQSLDITEEIKEGIQLSKIKSSYEIFPYMPRETTTQSQFISPFVIWIYNKILRFVEEQKVEKQKTSTLDIQKEYYLYSIEPFLKYEQERQKLEQLALSIIVQKFRKIEKVKSIYVQRYREELQIFVLLLGNKYDANLMDDLLDIEYEIRKMFPDIVFQFFYPPASISEKEDFIHPQAKCIYMR
jgi:hypothetical protein